MIAGFGIVSRYARLEDWLAWECFAAGNSAPNFGLMQARVDEYRLKNELKGGSGVPQIGCTVLSDAVFFPPDLCILQPANWPPRNLRPMRYDLALSEGKRVWDACQANLSAYTVSAPSDLVAGVREVSPRYGAPVLTTSCRIEPDI